MAVNRRQISRHQAAREEYDRQATLRSGMPIGEVAAYGFSSGWRPSADELHIAAAAQRAEQERIPAERAAFNRLQGIRPGTREWQDQVSRGEAERLAAIQARAQAGERERRRLLDEAADNRYISEPERAQLRERAAWAGFELQWGTRFPGDEDDD